MDSETRKPAAGRPELRRPFSDAYKSLIMVADDVGFPHAFDLDDALLVAQATADRRAQGQDDPDPTEIIVAPLGQLPYTMLSYLGKMPPTALLTAFRTRTDRILEFIADGSIELPDKVGDRIELVHSRRDLRILRRRWLKTPEGETPLTNNELISLLMDWCRVVMQVLMEFLSNGAPPSALTN